MIIVNISEKHIALYWKNLEFLYLYVNWLICWADSHDDARFSILTQQNFGSNCFHASQKFVDQHRKIASLTLVSSPLAYGSRVVLCFSQFYCMFTSLFSLGNSFFSLLSFHSLSLLPTALIATLFRFSVCMLCLFCFFPSYRTLCVNSVSVCVRLYCAFLCTHTCKAFIHIRWMECTTLCCCSVCIKRRTHYHMLIAQPCSRGMGT